MNATIHALIDHMFKDTVMNSETRALHEELLNNCLEHYDDLIQRGMSETEAIDAVVESLKGMKEVIDEYPKVAANNENKEEDKDTEIKKDCSRTETPVKELPSEYIFESSDIGCIRTELKSCDLKISHSQDGRIHVRCEDPEQISCKKDGKTLIVRVTDKNRDIFAETGKKAAEDEYSLKGLMNFIGKAIGNAVSNISVSWNVYIELPLRQMAELNLESRSGDVDIHSCLPEKLIIHTMSGEITVNGIGEQAAKRVNLSTMSGDIELNGNASQIAMSSMSGDIEAEGNYLDAELKSTSGDCEITGEAEHIRLATVSGDVNVNLRNTSVERIEGKSTSGDVEINLAPGTNSIHPVISSVSGTAFCMLQDEGKGARVIIQASSVSGDVKIR